MSNSTEHNSRSLTVRHLGLVEYVPVWEAMQKFTDERGPDTDDEIWFLQHLPVFTQGQAGREEHLLSTGDIPVVQVDRGGQVTYHGPGQLVAYLLIDLKRIKLGVRELVTVIERTIVKTLADYGIKSAPRADAPGVYIEGSGAKIAQLGLRIRRGCTFHGLSLNVSMNMEPFLRINPCGHTGLEVTSIQLQSGVAPEINSVSDKLLNIIVSELGYRSYQLAA